ncbi:MAG: hypothetical protein EPN57_07030 [Paraburkholderia sp.]|nr:MAG: hypothetical protein EPN57_07030 [Paraburkholderia sp.]
MPTSSGGIAPKTFNKLIDKRAKNRATDPDKATAKKPDYVALSILPLVAPSARYLSHTTLPGGANKNDVSVGECVAALAKISFKLKESIDFRCFIIETTLPFTRHHLRAGPSITICTQLADWRDLCQDGNCWLS